MTDSPNPPSPAPRDHDSAVHDLGSQQPQHEPHDPAPVTHGVVPDDYLAGSNTVGAWFSRLLKGIMVGIGFILPGLSGGVLAVIFRIYDPMIKFLAKPQHKFVKNVLYFIPVGIGGAIGVVLFSVLVEKAFGQYAAQFTCLFIGFVIGTFPSLYRTAGKQGRTSKHLMILAIARKEFVDLARDGRFRWAASAIALLLVAATAVGWRGWSEVRAERGRAEAEARHQFEGQEEKNPHAAAHYGLYVFKPKATLAFLDPGVDPYTGVSVYLEAHRRNDPSGVASA